MRDKFLLRLILLTATVVFGYILIRTVLTSDFNPMVTELFAAIIGFALTVMTTSLLLSKQTEAELRKEESVQFLNLKMNIYVELLNQLKDIIAKKRINPDDVMELRLLNQRISFIGSPDVLVAFNKFVRAFAEIAHKQEKGDEMIDNLLDEMSLLTVHIRNDLFQTSKKHLNADEIKGIILSSDDLLDINAR
ncbi:MAG: hypothetical protein CMN32_03390 [Saprospirales bacterium]|nr:hypothetical protein [Saprospirales bacterium]